MPLLRINFFPRNTFFSATSAQNHFNYKALRNEEIRIRETQEENRISGIPKAKLDWLDLMIRQMSQVHANATPLPKFYYGNGGSTLVCGMFMGCATLFGLAAISLSLAAPHSISIGLVVAASLLGASGLILWALQASKSPLQINLDRVAPKPLRLAKSDCTYAEQNSSFIVAEENRLLGVSTSVLATNGKDFKYFWPVVFATQLDYADYFTKDLCKERGAIFTFRQGRQEAQQRVPHGLCSIESFGLSIATKDLFDQCCLTVDNLVTLNDRRQIESALQKGWDYSWMNLYRSGFSPNTKSHQFLLHGAMALTVNNDVFFLVQGSCSIMEMSKLGERRLFSGKVFDVDKLSENNFDQIDAIHFEPTAISRHVKPKVFCIARKQLQESSIIMLPAGKEQEVQKLYKNLIEKTFQNEETHSKRPTKEQLIYRNRSPKVEIPFLTLEPSFFSV